jgi:hypothetical protein
MERKNVARYQVIATRWCNAAKKVTWHYQKRTIDTVLFSDFSLMTIERRIAIVARRRGMHQTGMEWNNFKIGRNSKKNK